MPQSRVFSVNVHDDNSGDGNSKSTKKLPFTTTPIHYTKVPARTTSIYPTSEFAAMVQGRHKRAMGSLFGINNFGMNITTLQPIADRTNTDAASSTVSLLSSSSSIVHYHTKQDEMICILSGTATLVLYDSDTNTYEEIVMTTGDVMGFPAGRTVGHSVRNRSTTESVTILEVGDRMPGDTGIYPEPSIDLCAKQLPNNNNESDNKGNGSSSSQYHFFHKDGSPY